ncbi:hypothetical protein [Coleofasciculus sp. FACHB-125]|nr:hypothetical protein [Coleofasciculus sp. FACHB-125]
MKVDPRVEVIAALQEACQDEDESVRQAAKEALRQIQEQS